MIVQGKNCQTSQGCQTINSSETQCNFRASPFFPLVKTITLKRVIYCTTIMLKLKKARKTNPE